MRRWAIRIIVGGIIVLILVGAAVQFVLMSDLPRKWILRAASEQTGLTVAARSLSVGWMGRTRLDEVVVSTPLNDEPVLSVESVDLSHRSIVLLAITRSLGLDSVRIDKPEVHLRQDASGRWNVQDVVARLAARGGPDSNEGAGLALPRLDIRDAFLHITDANESTETIGPVSLFGVDNGVSSWGFNLKIPPGIELHGELAQGGNWAQRIDFDIATDESLIATMLPPDSGPIRASGRWSGQIRRGGLAGRLRLDRLEAGPVALAGTIDVAVRRDGLALEPRNLAVIEPNVAGQKARLTAGSISLGPSGIRADQLAIVTESVVSQIDGRWDLGTRSGEFSIDWAGSLPGQSGQFNGTSDLTVKSPQFGRKEMKLTTALKGRSSFGELRIGAEIRGAGRSWQESLWEASVGEFNWAGSKRQIDLGGAAARITVDWPQVELMSLTLPDTVQTDASARLNVDTLQWSLQVAAKGFKRLGEWSSGLDIRLDGSGDRDEATISELSVTEGDRMAIAKGVLAVASGEIRQAHVSAKWSDQRRPDDGQKTSEPPGQWVCEVDVEGMTRPMDLHFDGTVTGRNVRLGKRMVARLDIPLEGTAGADHVQISTEPFDLLQGRWQFSGRHDLSKPLTQLGLTIDNLSLQAAAEMAGSPLKYRGQAKAQLQVAVPDLTMDKALAHGAWEVTDLSIPPFEARQGRGRLRISEGLVRFDEIVLEQEQGQAQGSMQFRLDQPQRVAIEFKTTEWPLEWEPQAAKVLIDSNAALTIDVQRKMLDGQVQISSRLLLKDEILGRLNTSMRLSERTVNLHEVNGELLGGQVAGSAEIPLDRWVHSTGRLQWQGIEPNQLTPWWPQAARFEGKLSGTLTAGLKKTGPRNLEPMQLELHTEIPDGRFGQMSLNNCAIVAYLGRDRLLVDSVDIQAMGGLIKGWARVSPHKDSLYLTSVVEFDDIDLVSLSQMTDPNGGSRMVGRLSGRTTLLTSSDWRHLSGQAELNLSKSDLADTPILRTLYNTLSLNIGRTEPEGTGQVRIRFDGTRIRIPSFVYFNRGVEVRGAGQIDDFTHGQRSSVEGYAVGSTRVLKGLSLPGVRELDRLMASMQSGVASVTVGGEVGNLEVAVVPLPAVSGPLRRLLWSQLRE